MHPLAQLAPNPRQAAALAAAVSAALGLAAYAIFRRRPTPDEIEATRRNALAQTGRIVDGILIDAAPDLQQPETLIYRYRVAGVTYECAQAVAKLQLQHLELDAPIQVRYNRDNPADSIVVAENWNGLWSATAAALHRASARPGLTL